VKVYEGKDVRNLAVVGHGKCGKTSLVAAMLYTAGVTSRLTSVDEGNTITDFDEEEIERKVTISTGVAFLEWKKRKVNLLDTPGFNIFMNDTKLSMVAADAALVVVDAAAGVEVQTEKVWQFAEEYQLPRALVINKLDRENTSFDRALGSIHEVFGRQAVPIQLPLGSEKDFRGVIDLITMKAYQYTPGGQGKGEPVEIPGDLVAAAEKAHEQLVEMVAEGKDELMEEFFEQGTLSPERLLEGLQEAIRERRLYPVLCSSATLNIGTDLILDFIVDHFPRATDRGQVWGKVGEQEVSRRVADDEPASIYVFKTMADPFAGRVSYFKVMSGVVKNDANLQNSRTDVVERLAHIGCPRGKEIVPVTELHAGDIGVVAKLKDTLTGDTLYDRSAPIAYPKVKLPEPSIAYAITPKTRQDEDRMGMAIQKILEEDPSLRFYRDPQTKEFLLAGSGQQQVEVVVSKLNKRYGVQVELRAPKIPYRETIRATAEAHGRHKKQTGGHGQFGDCKIRMSPLPRGQGFEFVNNIFGGAIPKQFIPAVEKGILEAAEEGFLAGYPVVDFKVELYDGAYHEVDSSELSFKLAARKAFRLAMQQAQPALLEPIMNVEIHVPAEFAGDIMGDINSRRGRVTGMDVKGNMQIIRAQVPMAEMLTYQNDLTSMTQARGSFTMEFSHYDFVPPHIAEKIIAQARAAREGAAEEEE